MNVRWVPAGQLLFVLALLAIAPVSSAELYKYTNEDGVIVLDSRVPTRYVKNGYTILSLDGRVIEVVPRALSAEEIRQRDELLAEQKRQEKEREDRENADQNLLRLYSTPEDVIRARDTKLASIHSFINTQEGNLRRLAAQKRQQESNLADIERSGGTISKDRLERIRVLEARMQQIETDIGDKLAEIDSLTSSYALDLKRVRELYGSEEND